MSLSRFLQNHRVFKPVGVLVGKYFNFNGQETQQGKLIQEKIVELEIEWDKGPISGFLDSLPPASQAEAHDPKSLRKCKLVWADHSARLSCVFDGDAVGRTPRRLLPLEKESAGKLSAALPLDQKDCICMPNGFESLDDLEGADGLAGLVVVKQYAGCELESAEC
mmetsp:Transcript_44975/g.70516  ORF Transcript_44975/g.70516 Transcript_44975/m.70516 type:complete len:165 (+) Transcript_44975:315-809(+)